PGGEARVADALSVAHGEAPGHHPVRQRIALGCKDDLRHPRLRSLTQQCLIKGAREKGKAPAKKPEAGPHPMRTGPHFGSGRKGRCTRSRAWQAAFGAANPSV